MAVLAFDAAGGPGADNTNNITWSHTCTGSNLILFVFYIDQTNDGGGTVTYNGVSMTQFTKKALPSSRELYGFYLINPSTGSNTVQISTGNAHIKRGVSVSYTGALQSGQPDSFGSNSGSSSGTDTASTSVISGGCWLVGAAFWTDGTTGDAPSNGTARVGTPISVGGANIVAFDSNGIVGTGSQSMGYVLGASTSDWGVIIASVAPVTPPTNSNLLMFMGPR